MATQKDVQDLLRMLTTGRNKIPMMQAMGRIKSLQAASIRSIRDIANADLQALSKVVGDEKAAKQLQSAAKKESDPTQKRAASDTISSPDAKRKKSAYELGDEPLTPEALEASLALPEPSVDEEEISRTTIYTNRAPLGERALFKFRS
jgi:transcription-repair coupling factor (superfamily II helicase)